MLQLNSRDDMKLSPRQVEVMRLICGGSRDKEIACKLNISMQMVSRHVSLTLRKLKAANRCHAVAILCQRKGW